MNTYVIALGPRSNRRYLAEAFVAKQDAKTGWRPYVWVRDIEWADKWAREDEARAFAEMNLPHDQFDVITIPPMGVPGGDGGTPAAAVARAA